MIVRSSWMVLKVNLNRLLPWKLKGRGPDCSSQCFLLQKMTLLLKYFTSGSFTIRFNNQIQILVKTSKVISVATEKYFTLLFDVGDLSFR